LYVIKTVLSDGQTIYSNQIEVQYPAEDFVQVYPNPVFSNTIYFNAIGDLDNASIHFLLYDIKGRIVHRHNIKIHCKELSTNIQHLSNGHYFYHIEINKMIFTGKIIKS